MTEAETRVTWSQAKENQGFPLAGARRDEEGFSQNLQTGHGSTSTLISDLQPAEL